MRRVNVLPQVVPFRKSADSDARLEQWLREEVESAIASTWELTKVWQEARRQYEGVPRHEVRNTPIENAPNFEVTLGAIAVDSLYAQVLSHIFDIAPVLTARASHRAWVEHAKALQSFVNWGVVNEWSLRPAAEHAFLDCIQLGTGGFHIPYAQHIRKRAAVEIMDEGPIIEAAPCEDLIVRGGAGFDPQTATIMGLRMWMTRSELNVHGADPNKRARWDVSHASSVGTIGFVRSDRERLGRSVSDTRIRELFEVYKLYCHFDYDNDGIDEDMLVIWDRTSGSLMWRGWTPEDLRPIEVMRYQTRAHLWPGIGVMEMLGPYQSAASEITNARLTNMLIANTRMWAGVVGAVDEGMLTTYPGRVIPVNSKDDLTPLQMGEVYPSSMNEEAFVMGLAERRVGTSELSQPRPSAVLGSRTPAFTTASLLQQQNKRFGAAFDGMKNAASAAVRQCVFRYREQLLRQGTDGFAAQTIKSVLGDQQARMVIAALRRADFPQHVLVELTASTAIINRDSERQNALLLVQILGAYNEKMTQLVLLAAQPNVPGPVRKVAKKIAATTNEIIERTIRTFDQIRDPEDFIVDVQQELDQIDAEANVVQQLTSLVAAAGGGQVGNGIAAQSPLSNGGGVS